jgi:hypothetical protein
MRKTKGPGQRTREKEPKASKSEQSNQLAILADAVRASLARFGRVRTELTLSAGPSEGKRRANRRKVRPAGSGPGPADRLL